MAYSLSAFIARAGTFAPYQALGQCITIVSLAQGFEMLLNDSLLKDAIGSQPEFAQAQPRLNELKQAQVKLARRRKHITKRYPFHLTDALVAFGLSFSRRQPIAYVEAEFFGGMGEQYGVIWDKGQIALLPSTNGLDSHEYADKNKDAPINSVLRVLGAQAEIYDEFAALGLGLERGVRGWVRRFNPHANDCEAEH